MRNKSLLKQVMKFGVPVGTIGLGALWII